MIGAVWRHVFRPRRLIDRLAAPLDEMMQMLVQQSGAGILVIDRAGCIVRVNEALGRMAGRACDLSPGRPMRDIFCEPGRDAVWNALGPALQDGRPPPAFAAALHGEGMERTVEVSAVPVREGDGQVSGLILHLRDISAQKRLEAQLSQSQKLQAVGQLAGGIAHDFNNLLTAMIGAADEVLARGTSDAATVEDVQQIRSSAQRGADLVRQLLAFGRQQTLQPRGVAVNDAVQSLSALLQRLLGSTVRLKLDLETPGSTVHVDPTQLDQVLVNLAVNARDAMPQGGELTLHTGHITLYRPLARGQEQIPPGRYVMVEVQDTGIGIPPDVLPRIFDPFFTTKREQGGTGLGLSTVHGIVRQSNGFLGVESVVGKGTRIRIYLPRQDDAAAALPAPATEAPAPQCDPAGRAVLLVDDDDGVRRLATRALTNSGWRVLSVPSAEAALALLADDPRLADRLCAVVSDVVMPGMDGPALVRAVRERHPGLPAILASGYAEETVHADLAADDILFLSKPYTLKVLAALVAERALPAPAAQTAIVA